MAIYPDKTLLAAGGYQHISIYDTISSSQTPTYTIDSILKNVVSIGFHDHGNWMFSAGEDKTVRIWDIRTKLNQTLKTFTHTQPISCAVLHPNQVRFNTNSHKSKNLNE